MDNFSELIPRLPRELIDKYDFDDEYFLDESSLDPDSLSTFSQPAAATTGEQSSCHIPTDTKPAPATGGPAPPGKQAAEDKPELTRLREELLAERQSHYASLWFLVTLLSYWSGKAKSPFGRESVPESTVCQIHDSIKYFYDSLWQSPCNSADAAARRGRINMIHRCLSFLLDSL